MDQYRRPYLRAGEERRATLTWPREIPLDGTPEDVHRIVTDNSEFMTRTRIPKLFINGDPGALLTGPLRDLCRRWPHQRETTVPGLHFLPEDSPHLIGRAIADWLRTLP
jgi:haloalkane dehalogenase